MLDVNEFAFLKKVGQVLDELEAHRPVEAVSTARLMELAAQHDLSPEQTRLLAMHLRQCGYDVKVPVGPVRPKGTA